MAMEAGLRVLVPCNRVPNNPFFFNFLRALDADPGIRSVQYGTDWLRFPETPFDVVHLQWPEALLDWRNPRDSDVARLRDLFAAWKRRGVVLALTVHNEFPHGRATEAFHELYSLVFGSADICFHFGQRSIDVVTARYGNRPDLIHTVVPHGCYERFLTVSAEPASVSAERPFTIFSLGRIRSQAEADLLVAVAAALEAEGGRLVVAGRLPNPSRARPVAWARTRWPFWRRRCVELIERFVTDDEVEALAQSADVILVPRLGSLNSGNVALAFSLGKVALGPGGGVIGEELERLGNPTFDPADLRTVAPAVALARSRTADGQQARRNRDYAQTELAWNRVAAQYVAGYDRCRSGHNVHSTEAANRG